MKRPNVFRSLNWRLAPLALLIGTALVPATTSSVPVHAQSVHAVRALLQQAAHDPHAEFRVIVQGRDTRTASRLVRSLGGRVTRDLTIIHGFAAELPATAVRPVAVSNSVNWMSPDTAVIHPSSYTCCSSSSLTESYAQSVGAASLWGTYQGAGVGVAVVDSGINGTLSDLQGSSGSRVIAQAKFNSNTNSMSDGYGHGTHVAGIIGGNGTASNGGYVGIAPNVNLISVKVSDDSGGAAVSDVVNGLQWVLNNKSAYNIRVVNLSLNSTVADSYQVDPLDAAVETLWKAGIVVVASAGNNGSSNPGVNYAPGDDPLAISVGAANDQGTASTSDDTLASFSAYSSNTNVATTSGAVTTVNKPDLVAPGVDIISDLASGGATLAKAHAANVVGTNYFMMSGTSMAAPVVSGVVALLLQKSPNLTPDQVKYRLMSTATKLAAATGTGAGEVNANAALNSTSTVAANSGIQVAASLLPGDPAANWGSAAWGSAAWGSTSWNSAAWGSASWGSASWGSAAWGSASWGSDYWGK